MSNKVTFKITIRKAPRSSINRRENGFEGHVYTPYGDVCVWSWSSHYQLRMYYRGRLFHWGERRIITTASQLSRIASAFADEVARLAGGGR